MDIQRPDSEYFRLIHPKDYDSETGKFKSLAFRPSSNGGISVVRTLCATETSQSVCQHVAHFYANQTGVPEIYWDIPSEGIPAGCGIEQSESATGDACHYDIFGWSKGAARSYFKSINLEDMTICAGDGERPLIKEDLE